MCSLILITQHHKTFPSFSLDSPYLVGEMHCTVKKALHCRPRRNSQQLDSLGLAAFGFDEAKS